MTTRDFNIIAEELYVNVPQPYSKEYESFIHFLCRAMKRCNPRFDQERFLERVYRKVEKEEMRVLRAMYDGEQDRFDNIDEAGERAI